MRLADFVSPSAGIALPLDGFRKSLVSRRFMNRAMNEAQTVSDHQSDGIYGFDYIELYVGNAYQAAHYYGTSFGFRPLAYVGLETGERRHTSVMLEQGGVRLILTAALNDASPVG